MQHVSSLEATLPWSMIAIQAAGKEAKDRYDTFVREHCTIENQGDQKILSFDPGLQERFNKIRRRRRQVGLAGRLVPRSFVVSLVSQYDAFLGGLIRVYFGLKPDALTSSEKSISLAQLVEFGSIDAAKEYIVEKEVESVLRKSHSEQFDWLEQRLDIALRKDLAVWPIFVEVTERRNLFVHTNGTVSSQYLSVCRKQKVDCAAIKVGDELHVTPSYFTSAYEAVFEIGVKLAHVFWRKVLPGDREAADGHLLTLGYDLLVDGEFRLAAGLMDFAVITLKKHSSDHMRRLLVINRAQAYKWLGEQPTCEHILRAEDWTAVSDDFRIAVAVLRDQVPEVLGLMKRIGSDGAVESSDYREWPLFRELRKNSEFVATFENVFGEAFDIAPRLEPTSSAATESTPADAPGTNEANPPDPSAAA